MNKAFVKYGLLGVTALMILTVGTALLLAKPAVAQGGGGVNTYTVLYAPVQLPNDPGQSLQLNAYYYSNSTSHGDRPMESVFDILVDFASPTAPATPSLRRTFVVPHVFDTRGRVSRTWIVQSGDNFDVYVDGTLAARNILNGLPPGIPITGFAVSCYTSVYDRANGNRVELNGSLQTFDSTGKTTTFTKSHPLSGTVTLMK